MMIFKKAIPRRVFLRGMGATLALPLLDGMVPACASSADTAAKAPVRLGVVYVPDGMWPMEQWTPKTEGAGFALTPTLEPLAPFRDRILVLTGLAQKEALTKPGEATADHSCAFATYLTGVHPKHTAGKDFRVGISMDQIAAEQLGKKTQLASLELSLFTTDLVGTCEAGETCTYLTTLCWKTSWGPRRRRRRPMCRPYRRTRIPRSSPCASGWKSTAPIPSAPPATPAWIRWASRSTTLTPSAGGEPPRPKLPSLSMSPGHSPTALNSRAR